MNYRTMKFFLSAVLLSVFATFVHAQALSDYAENSIITHIFRTGSFTKPSVLAVALGTACSDSSFTEISQTGSYARVAANPSDSNWAATNGTNGQTSNVNTITFPQATADWNGGSAISYFAVYDSASYGAGNLIFCTALTTPRVISSGATASFGAGSLTFTIQ